MDRGVTGADWPMDWENPAAWFGASGKGFDAGCRPSRPALPGRAGRGIRRVEALNLSPITLFGLLLAAAVTPPPLVSGPG